MATGELWVASQIPICRPILQMEGTKIFPWPTRVPEALGYLLSAPFPFRRAYELEEPQFPTPQWEYVSVKAAAADLVSKLASSEATRHGLSVAQFADMLRLNPAEARRFNRLAGWAARVWAEGFLEGPARDLHHQVADLFGAPRRRFAEGKGRAPDHPSYARENLTDLASYLDRLRDAEDGRWARLSRRYCDGTRVGTKRLARAIYAVSADPRLAGNLAAIRKAERALEAAVAF